MGGGENRAGGGILKGVGAGRNRGKYCTTTQYILQARTTTEGGWNFGVQDTGKGMFRPPASPPTEMTC